MWLEQVVYINLFVLQFNDEDVSKTFKYILNCSRGMDKRVVIGLVIAGLLILGFIFLMRPRPVVWSENPEDWVKKDGKVMTIDVIEATKGKSRMDFNGQQYETETIGTVFETEGWYNGNYFKTEYVENGRPVMRINQDMVPGDGIIEGFVVERLEPEPFLYVFLDEDWKQALPNTMVYWGKRRQLERAFDFGQEVSSGIYMNKLADDPSRFENNFATHHGGAWIGYLADDKTSTILSFN